MKLSPYRRCDGSLGGTTMKKFAIALLIASGSLALETGSAQAADLQASWSGGGPISFASGGKEYARCRARYSRRSNEGYVVSAVCATPSARAEQTASLRKVSDNTYRGTFYNREYGVSGTILVIVRGTIQTVRLTSEAGWALLTFSK